MINRLKRMSSWQVCRHEIRESCHESDPRRLQTNVVARSCHFFNELGLRDIYAYERHGRKRCGRFATSHAVQGSSAKQRFC